MYKYAYNVNHAEARCMAEIIALAPASVFELFQILTIKDERGYDAQFYWTNRGAAKLLFNDAAIAQVKNVLADAVASYAVTRTASHVPKWTFMYNPTCKEDVDAVAAIRASPPPVAIQFAVNTNLPPGEHCVLFPRAGYGCWAEPRERLLTELKNCTDRCFPPRPTLTSRFTVVFDARAVSVRQVVAQLKRLAENIEDQMLFNSETVTTLWVKEDTSLKVYYGDCAVLSQLCTYSMTPEPPACPLLPPPYAYHYRPDHDGARHLAEMIALAQSSVNSLFSLHSDPELNVYASFSNNAFPVIGDAALAAAKEALMDEVARATHHEEYTFYYNPACQLDLEAIVNLRSYPPNVAMHVACVKQEFDFEDDCCSSSPVCSFRWCGDEVLYRGAVARAKMEETLSAIKAARFRRFVPQSGYRWSMVVRSLVASPSGPENVMLDEIMTALRSLPENTVHVRFYNADCVVTAFWADNGKRTWWGDAAVLGQLKELVLQLAEPAPMKSLPTHGFDGVRFQMFVKDKERALFLAQLDTVPAVWRRRIATVFVQDDVELIETCVHMWPPIGSLPRPTHYQDVMAMLV